MRLAALAVLVASGCSSPTTSAAPSAVSPPLSGSAAGASASPAVSPDPSSLAAALHACPDDARWRCGFISVPIDRLDPAAGKVDVHFYVSPHTDASRPALEPVLVSPGGPGASIWADHGWLPMSSWEERHDTVLVDPRGVGASAAIACPDLDAGVGSAPALESAVAACAAKLGATADRYGNGDVAHDIEAVRASLGIDAFDYYAASFATVTAQAYALRFPARLHALVLDSGFSVAETLRSYYWGVDMPSAWLRTTGLLCARDPSCASAYPQPEDVVRRLIAKVAASPVRDPATAGAPVVDEAAMQALLASTGARSDQLQAKPLLDAAAALLERGDGSALLRLASQYPLWGGGASDPTVFSNGDNAAAMCNDIDTPWARTDPVSARPAKLSAAIKAFPPDIFVPFTVSGFAAGAAPILDQCLSWPIPHRYEPVVPAGAAFPSVPTLVLSGDLDTQAPTEVSKRILASFPSATFVVVEGAGHDSASPMYGTCGVAVVGTFLDTLSADPNACATTQ
jgi:pimeloyl-ACP methyl ester carboxylesterase